jgi:eukaryotic-like serine/threonine-protein kinase
MISKGYKVNDRYEIIKTIGEGGMANVYLAYDTILDRNVAVKILRGDLASDDKFVRRFQREAISASSLSHPNIVEMYDVGEDDGKYYIVMEYVNGKTLKNLIKKRGKLVLPEIIDIMLQLTSGIAHAHDSYIIHRDIKPQNIMILDDGMVKITDFGIAMAVNANEITQTNSVMGSVHYLPPEQANGSGSTIKSDIYSLGILMFELLTGKIPFKGDNAVEIAIKQMKEQIPSVCKINEEIPQSIENIILKACAKNPKNRYESAREMYEDIKSCLDADKQNEKRYVYKFPEQELEKTKKIPLLSKINTNIDERIEKTMSDKTTNKFIILGTLVTAFLSLLILGIVIIYPMLVKVPEVKIPDVSGKTPLQAEEMLRELGLTVASTDEEKPSESVEEGLVIETKPGYNRSVKKGTEVTLVISKGTEKITLSDYTNLNFYEIKTLLETKGIIVLQEQKEVEELNDLKEYTIIDQFPLKDTVLQSGDTVTLYTPKIITEYPDFVGEKWTLDEVNEFLANYEIVPRVKYEIREDVEPGTVVFQSRLAGSIIQNKAIFSITVASAPEDVEPDNLETE